MLNEVKCRMNHTKVCMQCQQLWRHMNTCTRSLRSSVVKHALMEEATHTLFVLRGGNSTYLPRYSLCVSWVLVSSYLAKAQAVPIITNKTDENDGPERLPW